MDHSIKLFLSKDLCLAVVMYPAVALPYINTPCVTVVIVLTAMGAQDLFGQRIHRRLATHGELIVSV